MSTNGPKVMTLAVDEFIRRFLIHVLPSGVPPHSPLRPVRQWQPGTVNIARARSSCSIYQRPQRRPDAGGSTDDGETGNHPPIRAPVAVGA